MNAALLPEAEQHVPGDQLSDGIAISVILVGATETHSDLRRGYRTHLKRWVVLKEQDDRSAKGREVAPGNNSFVTQAVANPP
jgi:hypothetical protein